MLNQDDFLVKYRHSREDFAKTGLEWSELKAIFDDHSSGMEQLLNRAALISADLRRIDQVHSIGFRVKDPEHLIDKIIRKKKEDPERTIDLGTYRTEVTDLIGVRALHLFKDDWVGIHAELMTWDLADKPVANIRKGDPDAAYEEAGCRVVEHPSGYRSVHYAAHVSIKRDRVVAEIQVRTIFEEGWSEIDHRLRYPSDTDNLLLSEYLRILNMLAGTADQMGTFINFLKREIESREATYRNDIAERELRIAKMIDDLGAVNEKLKDASDEKRKLEKTIESLKQYKTVPGITIGPSSTDLTTIGGGLGSSGMGVRINDSILDAFSNKSLGSSIFATSATRKCSKCGQDSVLGDHAVCVTTSDNEHQVSQVWPAQHFRGRPHLPDDHDHEVSQVWPREVHQYHR